MIRIAHVPLVIAASLAATPASAWGPIGHRVSADLAERNINGQTRAEIELILGEEGLEEAATWPDDQRSNPGAFWQETAAPFHYVTLPTGRTVDMLEHPPEGDAITALAQFTGVLRDPTASQEDKALALRFVVHIVGDLHMPLHVGKEGDRGGNDFKVLWFEAPTNLHWVWDEGMILRQQLSWSEYAERLSRRTAPGDVIAWWDADPVTWMTESVELRDRLYPATGVELGQATEERPVTLSWQYQYDWIPSVEQRLQQSGVRLAAYLDWVFAPES